MDKALTINTLHEMQQQAAKMRLQFSRLAMNRSLTVEQIGQADTRLENFHDDIDIILSDLGDLEDDE